MLKLVWLIFSGVQVKPATSVAQVGCRLRVAQPISSTPKKRKLERDEPEDEGEPDLDPNDRTFNLESEWNLSDESM